MEPLLSAHVWSQSVGVLIDLVRVTRLVTTGRGEGELSDSIESFITSPMLRRHLLVVMWRLFRILTADFGRSIFILRLRVVIRVIIMLMGARISVDTIDGWDSFGEGAIKRVGDHILLPAMLVSLT